MMNLPVVRWRMSSWLQLLGMLSLAPILCLMAYLSYELSQQKKAQILESLSSQSTDVVHSIESQIYAAKDTLFSVAQSEAAIRGDRLALYEQSRRVVKLNENFLAIVLVRLDGEIVFHTAIDYNSKAFPASHLDSIRSAVESGQSNVTGLIYTKLRPDPVVAVTVPLTLKGDPSYVLRMIMLSESLSNTLSHQKLPDGWIAAIVDRNGILLGRNISPGLFVGKLATNSFQEALQLKKYEPFEALSMEGISGTTLLSPIHRGDWHLGLFVPNSILNAPLNDMFGKLVLLTILWLGLGLLIAEFGSRFITRQVEQLVNAISADKDSTQSAATFRILEIKKIYDRFTETKKQLDELSIHFISSEIERKNANDLYDYAPCGYHSLDREGCIVKINQTELDWLGYRREELLGQPVTKLLDRASQSIFRANFKRLLSRGKLDDFELEIVRKDGSVMTMLIQISALFDKAGNYVGSLSTSVDISARKRLETQLELEAHSDPLTGLRNRRDFEKQSEREIARSLRQGSPLSILMFDIDHFKKVNDSYGHAAGDLVLKRLGEGFRKVFRETDISARIGGEEFAVLMPDTDIDTATEAAQRLRLWVAEEKIQIDNDGTSISVTASLGVAQMSETSASIQSLLKLADDALYIAKHEGRNKVCQAA